MIVFDITDKESFHDAVNYWLVEVKSNCPSSTQILLVGNKSDLEESRRVTKEDIENVLN